MKLVVVGTGYVGLISGVCLAAKGHDVACIDINPAVVDMLNAGRPHIHERGLEPLLEEVLRKRAFRASSNLHAAMDGAELVLVAVGTPSENGAIDLSYVKTAVGQIGAYLKTANRHVSVVIKSTVVPGTTDTFVRAELVRSSGLPPSRFGLGMNPEFLREGEAIEDFMAPDRIVFGHEDVETLERLEALYAPWDCDKLAVNTRTAELIKYANNAILATQISAMNEIANLSAAIGGVDMMDVVKGVSLDKRWSPIVGEGRVTPGVISYLTPGCGFGGSCFPKDVQALRTQGVREGLPMRMLNAVLSVNEAQPRQVADIIERDAGSIASKRVLLLGLAFKPDTDDVRESASLRIAADLVGRGAHVVAHDPIAIDNFQKAIGPLATEIAFTREWRAEIAAAEIIIVATRWGEYRALADAALNGKIVFDARRLFAPSTLEGARYLTIGRRIDGPARGAGA